MSQICPTSRCQCQLTLCLQILTKFSHKPHRINCQATTSSLNIATLLLKLKVSQLIARKILKPGTKSNKWNKSLTNLWRFRIIKTGLGLKLWESLLKSKMIFLKSKESYQNHTSTNMKKTQILTKKNRVWKMPTCLTAR